MELDRRTMDIPAEKFEFVQVETEIKDDKMESEPIGFYKDALLRLKKNKASVLAFYLICMIAFLAIVGPSFNPYSFREQNAGLANMPPRVPGLEKLGILDGSSVLTNRSLANINDPEQYPPGSVIKILSQRTVKGVVMADVKVNLYKMKGAEDKYFWLGTDYLGRDLWTRLMRGTRVSLLIAFLSVITNIAIGVVYGAIAGYYGDPLDMYMMRFCEILNAFPQIVVVTMFILFFGTGMLSIVLALVVRGWIPTARLIRAQFYRFKQREYVLAARTLGVSDRALIFRHILPNSIGPIITRSMIAIPGAIFTESFLAFIGLGLRPPEPSIGVLLSQGQKVLLAYPYQTLFPALLISVLMIAFNLFANGLRDAFDPTLRGQE
ncbi:MAG: ABC transporter permease [Bacillota bacterium]|jgi:oligopeptide transport system permease protein